MRQEYKKFSQLRCFLRCLHLVFANIAKRCQLLKDCISSHFPLTSLEFCLMDSILLHYVCLNNLNGSHSGKFHLMLWNHGESQHQEEKQFKSEHYHNALQSPRTLSRKRTRTDSIFNQSLWYYYEWRWLEIGTKVKVKVNHLSWLIKSCKYNLYS